MPDPAETSRPDELPFDTCKPAPGMVSSACRFFDHDARRFIQIHGQYCYSYHLGDRVTESMIWISIHQAGFAQMVEIAENTELSLRSLQRWNATVKKNGLQGLAPQNKRGPKSTISEVDRNLAVMLLEGGKTPGQITKQLGISYSRLQKIRAEHLEATTEPTDQWLDFGSDEEQPSLQLNPPIPEDTPLLSTTQCENEPEPSPNKENTLHSSPPSHACQRSLARLGLLKDAAPIFHTNQRVESAGFFMFVALLGQTKVLDIFSDLYEETLGPAFYGLRTTVMTLLFMFAIRVKRPESLRQHNPQNLAKVLGLDRIMEVKTLRRKLSTLADKNLGIPLMEKLAKDRLARSDKQKGQDQLSILYLDGHVNCYNGIFKIGQTWSATKNRVVKAKTNTWLNRSDQTSLLYLETPFNEGLIPALEANKERIEKLHDGEKPVLAFDRECWDVDFLHRLDQAGWKFITYRKGNYEDIALEQFVEVETRIGKRTYNHAPVDVAKQGYNHYRVEIDEKGKVSRKKIGQVYFREIRILSDDKSHQTAIVTNIEDRIASATVTSAAMFARWGNQENVFKYMIAEYGLDDLWEYNRSDHRGNDSRKHEEAIDQGIDHPNPDYTRLTREISKVVSKRNQILVRHGLAMEVKTGDQSNQISDEELGKLVKEIRAPKDRAELKRLNEQLKDLHNAREAIPLREEVAGAGYKQLRRGVSHLVDSLKMVAFEIETRLFEMLGPHYPNTSKEGRKLIAAALRTAGVVRIENEQLIVTLEAQASPNRTAAIDQVGLELNALQTKFPGTELYIKFETACQNRQQGFV